ncbi:MAG: glycosyltransferase [Spartobacteria bacterium]|nr:glycosyltransferase [Spartobacteria bacterium]
MPMPVTAPSPTQTLSVVIPVHNARATLPHCLEALAKQRIPALEYILVDNNSTDDSDELVRAFMEQHPRLPIIQRRESRPGAAAARNAGVAAATGDWIVFTDADCVPEPDWIANLAGALPTATHVAGLAGCITAAPSDSVIATFLGLYTLPGVDTERDIAEYTLIDGGFPTANLAIRRDVFNALDGFDERIPIYGEDHDLCARLYDAGYAIRTVPRAVVRHIHRAALKPFLRQAFAFGKSHALMLARRQDGAVIIVAPGVRLTRFNTRKRIWLDLNQADKKLLALLLAGMIWPFFWLLVPLYLVYLSFVIAHRIHRRNLDLPESHPPVFALLLILKSAALTMGRINGSRQYKVVCL